MFVNFSSYYRYLFVLNILYLPCNDIAMDSFICGLYDDLGSISLLPVDRGKGTYDYMVLYAISFYIMEILR
jgi:hypothetical protein